MDREFLGVRMRLRNRDVLNLGLILGTALVAWLRPFELFVLAYGVLGPLHYLTEISWLHDRKWFGSSRRDWMVPTLAAVGAVTGYVIVGPELGLTPIAVTMPGLTVRSSWGQLMTLLALSAGFGLAFARATPAKAVRAAGVFVIGLALAQTRAGRVLVSIFLVTLVHVLVFTSCFMLQAALKSRSRVGYAAWALHLALPLAMLALSWKIFPHVTASVAAIQRSAPFHDVLLWICRAAGVEDSSRNAAAAMRLVAFAYTYHYLNWFAKTGTTRWHAMPPRRLGLLGATWLVSLALLVIDWKPALVFVVWLSVAHVYLEFPLNWRTFAGIASELNMSVRGSTLPVSLRDLQ